MQIIISVMIIGLLWMIYDLINAPEVDDDENPISSTSEEDQAEESAPSSRHEDKKVPEIED